MNKVNYLQTIDGELFPIEHFKDQVVCLFFVRYKCKPARDFIQMLNRNLNLTLMFPNIVFTMVSCDGEYIDWDQTPRILDWLCVPFYPIDDRKQMYSTYSIDDFPSMIFIHNGEYYKLPRWILRAPNDYGYDSLIKEMELVERIFKVEEYVLL